jgi:hypothetical protein
MGNMCAGDRTEEDGESKPNIKLKSTPSSEDTPERKKSGGSGAVISRVNISELEPTNDGQAEGNREIKNSDL